MVTLKNSEISITICEKGAEVVAGKYINGDDFIWQGSPVWEDHSPVLFPICGTLIDNKCEFEGKEYAMTIHGFAQYSVFEVVEQTENSALFSLTFSEETLKVYPFKFELLVRYTIEGKTVITHYETKNLDDRKIYFSFGGHVGYYLPDGVENYYLELDAPRTLYSQKLDGPYLNGDCENVLENGTKIPLNSDTYRAYDLIFKDIDFSAISLYHNSGKKIVRAEFEGFPNLLVWSEQGDNFACIEPWHGLPDYTADKADRNFQNKKGLIELEVGKSFGISHKFILP